ncbi:MAG: HdeD family acid-resistance protein [Erythrobacter sp.]
MAAYPKSQYRTTLAGGAISRTEFNVLGIALVVVGLAALLFPLVAVLSFNFLVGITLFAGGLLTLLHAFRVRRWQGRAVQFLLAFLYIGGGLIFLANPFAGIVALIVTLGAFFTADGAARILLALQIRPASGWGLFLMSGLLSVVLGALVFFGVPSGWSVGFLGLVLGINMILTGFAFLACTGALLPRRAAVRRGI